MWRENGMADTKNKTWFANIPHFANMNCRLWFHPSTGITYPNKKFRHMPVFWDMLHFVRDRLHPKSKPYIYLTNHRPQTTHFLVYDTALCPTTRHERRKMSNDLKITWWVIIQGRKVFANIIILLTRGGHAQACPPADFDLQFSTTLHWRTSSHCRKKAINVLSSCLRYSSLFYNGALCIHLQGGFARRATACWQWMHMDIVWNLRCSLHM